MGAKLRWMNEWMNERVHIRHTRTISLTFAFRTCLLCHCYGSSCFVIYPTVRNNTAKLFVSSPTLFFNLRTSEPSGQNAKRDVWAPLERRKRKRERARVRPLESRASRLVLHIILYFVRIACTSFSFSFNFFPLFIFYFSYSYKFECEYLELECFAQVLQSCSRVRLHYRLVCM